MITITSSKVKAEKQVLRMDNKRKSGILLHPTSLPGSHGIGSIGKEAFDFVDFLIQAHQKLWQIFPLGPTGYGDSPYQCLSAFAGNPLLISLEKLIEEGLLSPGDLGKETWSKDRVDFGKTIPYKFSILKTVYQNFKNKDGIKSGQFESYCRKQSDWLFDFCFYMALKEHFEGKPWTDWPEGIKKRKKEDVHKFKEELSDQIHYQEFLQFEFYRQWMELKAYANGNGIQIVGDIPIFIAFDSADAWSHPDLFYFDPELKPVKVSGCPPDYFSITGQLWGNPLYNWEKLKAAGYQWWIKRFSQTLELVDIVRLDHFRGFAAYWAIPYGNPTAEFGTWEAGPGRDLFAAVEKALGKLPIIAEDLGVITPDVNELREEFGFPGHEDTSICL